MKLPAMVMAQRLVAVLYCFLIVYCTVWVPWVANFGELKDVHQGYGWVWSPPSGQGAPSLPVIATRVLAVTAISGAAFLLADKWKALLLVAVLAVTGILSYDFWTNNVAEGHKRHVHDCAVAKVAEKETCTSRDKNGYKICDVLPPQEEAAAVEAAERECSAEMDSKRKSVHEEIEEYKRQHGIAE